jgi:hypothetical protein
LEPEQMVESQGTGNVYKRIADFAKPPVNYKE